MGKIMALAGASLAFAPVCSQDTATSPVPVISPQRVDIRLHVRPAMTTVLIEADLTFRVERPADVISVYLRRDLELDVIEDAHGVPLPYRRGRTRIRIATPPLEVGALVTWRFRYRIDFRAALEETGQIMLTTPWYPHLRVRPDPREFQRYVPMAMSMTAALPRPWVLVSSGTNHHTTSDGVTTYTWRDSVPSSAIPLIIGRFEERSKYDDVGIIRGFFPVRSRSLIESYVEYITRAATFFNARIGRLNRRSWNLATVDLPQNVSGLTLPGVTLLDAESVGPEKPFPYLVLAHEIAHQWWNHYIEIPRARDAWLREGLPSYSALLFLENQYGTQMMRQELARSKRIALAIENPEPLALGFDMSTQDAIYGLNYHKAAAVLHMLREVMGLDGFTQLTRALHDLGGDVTTEVFVAVAGQIHGEDLSWFFDPWLLSADVPRFVVRYRFAADPDGGAFYELTGTIEQQGAAIRFPVLLRIPLEAAPPLEQTVWIEPGTTTFSVRLPSPARGLEFDPYEDLLHRGIALEQVPSGATSATPSAGKTPSTPS